MPGMRRLLNILRYGLGPGALERKRAVKDRKREERFQSELWERGDMAQRRYASYEEYLEHQKSKLDRVRHRLDETEDEDLSDFTRRFQLCTELSEARSVLCLGARVGTEVEALHDLGYFAVGIDLNPGENNRWVLPGDFHHVQFPDSSVDAIYTNCLDHVFDLPKVCTEVVRLLRPRGLFIADVLPGFEEGWTPGAYESNHWPKIDALIDRIEDAASLRLAERRDLGQQRSNTWTQLVFRNEAAAETPPADAQAASQQT